MIDTLLRIRVFVAVYEEGSFTAAAARENLTQSGTTQHIQKLEDYLGVKLFVRGSGNATHATPAAEAYYLRCVDVLRAHAQARLAVEPFARGAEGEIRVGLTPTLTRTILGPTLSAFMERYPNVVVRIVDAYSDLILERLRGGELDFAVVPGGSTSIGLRSRRFAAVAEFLLSNARHECRLSMGQPVRLRDLGPLRLVVPSEAQVRRALLEKYFADAGAIVERRLEIDTASGAIDFIQHSDWQGIYPSIALLPELSSTSLIINPLADPPLTLELFHVERTTDVASAAAVAFAEELSRQVDQATASLRSRLAKPSGTSS